ncbi:MAG: C45 family peptidase [Gemmataceae bacterium]
MFRYPEGEQSGGQLRYLHGLPVLTVAGSPEGMGEAVGALALRPAGPMAAYPVQLLHKYGGGWLERLFTRLGEGMIGRLEPSYRAEFEAIARTCGHPRGWMVLGNTLFDIKKLFACSAVLVEAERSATEGPLLGRNLDYPSEGYAHEYSLVTVYRPEGKLGFVSVGFPGLVGVLSGMNEAGLTLAILEVFQAPLFVRRLNLAGTPYAVCFRKILEECRTIDEARHLLSRLRRTTYFNVALADRGRVAAFEVTPARVHERCSAAGFAICSNHFQHRNLEHAFRINFLQTFDRERTLRRAASRQPRLGVADVQGGLHQAHQNDHTLQTMVFEPGPLRLHLAVGQLPSSGGPLVTLELADLLQGRSPKRD